MHPTWECQLVFEKIGCDFICSTMSGQISSRPHTIDLPPKWWFTKGNGTPYFRFFQVGEILGGGFKYFLFIPLLGEDFQFD